ncbi:unnamed protein product [Brugia timori]|uniref:Ovule protein n=1 Tax=Brugia timori TaxID=42155 RepID=A0A0R3QET0_9BILA|nr:unnamed protein product [Brugia timori]
MPPKITDKEFSIAVFFVTFFHSLSFSSTLHFSIFPLAISSSVFLLVPLLSFFLASSFNPSSFTFSIALLSPLVSSSSTLPVLQI